MIVVFISIVAGDVITNSAVHLGLLAANLSRNNSQFSAGNHHSVCAKVVRLLGKIRKFPKRI